MGVPSFSLIGLGSVSGSYPDFPFVQIVPYLSFCCFGL